MNIAGENHARNSVGEQVGIPTGPVLLGKRFQKSGLRAANDLHPFIREILREPRQRQAGSVDRWLANKPLQPISARDQFHAQGAGLVRIKSLDRDNVTLHGAKVVRPGIKGKAEEYGSSQSTATRLKLSIFAL